MPDEVIYTRPTGLRAGGRRLWDGVTAGYCLDPHEVEILARAATTVDVLDALAREIRRTGSVVDGSPSPLLREHREQSLALARLLVALRIPTEAAGGGDDGRTQRRGIRGVYGARSARSAS